MNAAVLVLQHARPSARRCLLLWSGQRYFSMLWFPFIICNQAWRSDVLEVITAKTASLLLDVAEGDKACEDPFVRSLEEDTEKLEKGETGPDNC